MKPFSNLKSPPFYANLYATEPEGGDAGLYSEALSTLMAAASLKAGYLGYSSDVDAQGNPVKVTYWTSHEALNQWLENTKDLLPARVSIEDCLGPTGCLWPWLNRLDTDDVQVNVAAA